MPLGSHHQEAGLLLRGPRGLVLKLDDGGEWRLDAPRSAEHHIGQRVHIEGTRDGFDLLAVERIAPYGSELHDQREGFLKRFARMIRGR
ncbi:MAG: DUF5818 domain-containing protein [Sphingobium sp.]|nr:DUF5818 domain-containing protein [Sphingobium sp. PNB]MDX3899734.1 DUF5818 domain-containing protein [Sphingobium sp.]